MLLSALPANAVNCNGIQVPVIVFMTTWCPHCKAIREYLTREHVEFKECDVERSKFCSEKLQQFTGQTGVPATFVCDKYVLGDDEFQIDALLQERAD